MDCAERLVPKKGLEPPHPCEYMDLNHARLPIPPLRLKTAPDKPPALDGKYSSILKGLLNVSNPPASKESSTPAPDLQSDRQDAPAQWRGAAGSPGCAWRRLLQRRDAQSNYA